MEKEFTDNFIDDTMDISKVFLGGGIYPMNTAAIQINGHTEMQLFTYIDIKDYRNGDIKAFNNKICYDSLSEAQMQARSNCKNLSNVQIVTIHVNMSETIFDCLCTEDIKRLEAYYNANPATVTINTSTDKKETGRLCDVLF